LAHNDWGFVVDALNELADELESDNDDNGANDNKGEAVEDDGIEIEEGAFDRQDGNDTRGSKGA